MPSDLQFIDANISSYQNIPASLYPTLSNVSLNNSTINRVMTPIINGLVPDTTGVFVTWTYPVSDDLFVHVAVGYQFQLVEGTFSNEEMQGFIPPGPVSFEQIVNLKTQVDPNNRYINLTGGTNGRVDIPSSTMQGGVSYTARVRALVFSELGAGTSSGQYFKYTQWGSVNFRINSIPAALNLRVNGVVNPSRIQSSSGVLFSFSFVDPDGPLYLYKIQIGTTPGIGFVPNIWDSGLISGGNSFGTKDFTLNYAGTPLQQNVVYYWRVDVQDGLSDGGFTSGNDSFSINAPPLVQSITVNGNETLYNSNPTVGNTAPVLSWLFVDSEGDPQRAYNLEVVQIDALDNNQQPFEILQTGDVFSSASTLTLPDLPAGGTIQVNLKVKDGIEFSRIFTGIFSSNAQPQVVNFLIDGRSNPGDVGTSTPGFSWTFLDDTPGDIQRQFRIQVATNDSFATLLWDSGPITSFSNSVIYGVTPSPVVAPAVLTHGNYYFVQVQVSDGISFSDYQGGFFAINTKPNSPTLLTPSAGAFSGLMNISWMEASPLDADGDTVTYTLEMTSRRSSNQGWEYLAGPYVAGTTFFVLDLSNIKAGNDYGVRVIANDGFVDSDPTLGTSPINSVGLGFTILNHPPFTPIFLTPMVGQDPVSSVLKAEWLENSPVDIDGDSVYYILELTRNAIAATPAYETLGVFEEGSTRTFVDVSSLPDGSIYGLRITAYDDKGGVGAAVLSPTFAVLNTPAITDFETLGTNLYASTSDGRVFKATESIWQLEENFESDDSLKSFTTFISGNPIIGTQNGNLLINSPAGATFILKVGPKT